jgi:hypothetical protein
VSYLGIVEQRRALGIRIGGALPLLAGPGGNSDRDGSKEEDSHDDKGEDPLQGDNLTEELRDANGGGKNAEREAHGVVLVDDDEEASVGENGPDEDVAKDAGDQVSRVGDHESSVPVDGDKGPGQGSRDDGRVDETRVGVVAEVQRREVEEVEDENDLGPVEVGADKEHHKRKVQQVVGDEVASNAGGGVHMGRVGREEVSNVAALEDEENDPEDGGNDRVHGEGARVEGVLVPDALPDGVAIMRGVNGVVDGDDDGEDPGEESEDLVSGDGSMTVLLPLAEGVIAVPPRHCKGRIRGFWEKGDGMGIN